MLKISDAPIMIFHGRFRYRCFTNKLADSDFFFSLSNKQERIKVNINKMFIWYLKGQIGFWKQ